MISAVNFSIERVVELHKCIFAESCKKMLISIFAPNTKIATARYYSLQLCKERCCLQAKLERHVFPTFCQTLRSVTTGSPNALLRTVFSLSILLLIP